MSYTDKIGIYQADCGVILGRHKMFSDYIKEFARELEGGLVGVDLGSGPNGPNGKYFSHCVLDGCDLNRDVVDSLGPEYRETFTYQLGSDQKLPYQDGELDFVVCSCVIQHLSCEDELSAAFNEIARVLKVGGKFYLSFKTGSHDSNLTHFNSYYQEERTFRVFDSEKLNFPGKILDKEFLLDDNFIPYAKIVFQK